MNQSRTLVVMTNGDVYYVSKYDADNLRQAIEGKIYKTFAVSDVKSGGKLVLQLHHISALVEDTSRG